MHQNAEQCMRPLTQLAMSSNVQHLMSSNVALLMTPAMKPSAQPVTSSNAPLFMRPLMSSNVLLHTARSALVAMEVDQEVMEVMEDVMDMENEVEDTARHAIRFLNRVARAFQSSNLLNSAPRFQGRTVNRFQ